MHKTCKKGLIKALFVLLQSVQKGSQRAQRQSDQIPGCAARKKHRINRHVSSAILQRKNQPHISFPRKAWEREHAGMFPIH